MSSVTTEGRGVAGGSNGRYLPFPDARAFARDLKLDAAKDYRAWAKTDRRPAKIPPDPDKVYPEFVSWPDWLGTAPRPYEQAKGFVHTLEIRTRDEWLQRYAEGGLPRDIPKWPQNVYKGQFTTWADWLGRPADFRFRSFEDARTFMRSLGLKSRREHTDFVQSDECPKDIPSDPAMTYAGKGWVSYDDYLGYAPTRFNRNVVLGLLRSLSTVVHELEPVELFSILQRKGVIGRRFPTNRNAGILRSLEQLCRSADPRSDIEQLADELEAAGEEDAAATEPEQADDDVPAGTEGESTTRGASAGGPPLDDPAVPPIGGEDGHHDGVPSPDADEVVPAGDHEDPGQDTGARDDPEGPPDSRTVDHFKSVDEVARSLISFDDELLDFLISNRVAQLWQQVLPADSTFDVARLRDEPGDTYFQEIKRRFFEQYDGATGLTIPDRYRFSVGGRPAPPTLMQKLTAHRVLTERRIGNWSGVGAGKTVAAILSALVVDARVTVVLAFNSTLEKWEEDIRTACPSAAVMVKERGPFRFDPERPTFLLFNYESFQQGWAEEELIPNLVDHHRVDFVILDEIQSARQRSEEQESTRRKRVMMLVTRASGRNPELRVLGMSATPVINNLYEARATLGMITGLDFSDSPTEATVENAVRYHRHLTRHGLRYRPKYAQVGEPIVTVVDGMDLLPQLRGLPGRGSIARLERILLQAKLRAILPLVRPGTLVYTQFVEEMVDPLKAAIEGADLKVGVYTGEVKDGLEAFKARLDGGAGRKADVLIGSAPIGTGIDGLQKVCDRLIFACLPWTGADYEQVVGRLTRLGGEDRRIEVHIPVVELTAPGVEPWSWDRYRLGIIRFKRTIADAALDGVIPRGRGRLPSKDEMYRQSMITLREWEQQLLASMPLPEGVEDPPRATGE